MVLQQSGDTLTGTYTHDDGKLEGTISGNTFTGTWTEVPTRSPPHDAGDVELTLSDDCNSFSGKWRYGSSGEMSGGWTGTRTGSAPPSGSLDVTLNTYPDEPTDADVIEIEAEVSGDYKGPLSYKWFKDGIEMEGETGYKIRFEKGVLPGNYKIRVQVTDDEGKTGEKEITLSIIEGKTGIRGDVLEANLFDPIPDATITATNLNTGASKTVNVNSDGTYSIHLEPGHYRVSASAPGYLTESGTFGDDVKVLSPHDEPYCTDCFTTFNFRMVIGGTGSRPAGGWKMYGHQTGFNDWEADLALNKGGTLSWTETKGANVGASRTGTWQFDGTTLTLSWASPGGGQTTWTSRSVSKNFINDGTYTVEMAPGGTWYAVRSTTSAT